jgi:hypothetical protein
MKEHDQALTGLLQSAQLAKREYELASENCPHWDYENGIVGTSEGLLPCCYELDDAAQRLKRALKTYRNAVEKTKQGFQAA